MLYASHVLRGAKPSRLLKRIGKANTLMGITFFFFFFGGACVLFNDAIERSSCNSPSSRPSSSSIPSRLSIIPALSQLRAAVDFLRCGKVDRALASDNG